MPTVKIKSIDDADVVTMIKAEELIPSQSIKVDIQTLESQELTAPLPVVLSMPMDKEPSIRAVIDKLDGLTQLGDV